MRADAVQLIDGPTGEGVTRLDLARLRPGQGYHFLHRADLIELLRKGALDAGVTLRLLARVESVDLSGPAPTVALEDGARIFFYDGSKNWWSRNGAPESTPIGDPCGPDSEMFYDFGTPHNLEYGEYCHPNCDCGRFMEIGNNVFMAYKKVAKGSLRSLNRRMLITDQVSNVSLRQNLMTQMYLKSVLCGQSSRNYRISAVKSMNHTPRVCA